MVSEKRTFWFLKHFVLCVCFKWPQQQKAFRGAFCRRKEPISNALFWLDETCWWIALRPVKKRHPAFARNAIEIALSDVYCLLVVQLRHIRAMHSETKAKCRECEVRQEETLSWQLVELTPPSIRTKSFTFDTLHLKESSWKETRRRNCYQLFVILLLVMSFFIWKQHLLLTFFRSAIFYWLLLILRQ